MCPCSIVLDSFYPFSFNLSTTTRAKLVLAVDRKLACKKAMVHIINIDEGFDAALAILRAGELVAIPTETVYGLGADATNADAVAAIFAAKGRPSFNPLIAHVSGLAMAEKIGQFDDVTRALAKAFWPGPLTLVVPQKDGSGIADPVTAGLDTIALRHPKGIMARLAERLGNPIAAPSANTSGKISPTLARHVANDLGDKVRLILDGGACAIGLESTIVKITGDQVTLLREGGVSKEALSAHLGYSLSSAHSGRKIESPGQLLVHYAPTLPVRLNALEVNAGDALLRFGNYPPTGASPVAVKNLSASGDLDEAAHNLFAMLSQLDKSGANAIAVQPIPQHGVGAAINDRLNRAAHKG